jgi:hypothetical protein
MVHPEIREDQQSHKSDKEIREIKGKSRKSGNQGNQGDQQIRPPFQNNYVNENYDGYFEDNMNQTGLQNAIMQFQRQYNLRNQKVPANPPKGNPPKGNPTKEAQSNIPSSSQPKKDSTAKDVVDKGKKKEESQKKIPETRKEIVTKEVEKTSSSFNFESEMAKIKIYVPFNELIKNNEYRNQIIKMLKMEQTSDTLNIQDDHPTILFGPRVEENSDAEEVPPFYVSLKIHDMTLHNAMLDSGASHNLMPKVVMDQLGLDITRPYKDLFSFDSRKVKCLGLIKDLVVSLAQIPAKNMVMDVVVVDIPPKFGMLLSRSWAAKLKGTLQMDMSYATIPVFGQDRRLYREVFLKYMVSNKSQPNNHPIYSVETELGSSIFFNDLCFEEKGPEIDMADKDRSDQQIEKFSEQQDSAENEMWSMSFDGVASREGAGDGVWILLN